MAGVLQVSCNLLTKDIVQRFLYSFLYYSEEVQDMCTIPKGKSTGNFVLSLKYRKFRYSSCDILFHDKSIIRRIHSIHCELHTLFSSYYTPLTVYSMELNTQIVGRIECLLPHLMHGVSKSSYVYYKNYILAIFVARVRGRFNIIIVLLLAINVLVQNTVPKG